MQGWLRVARRQARRDLTDVIFVTKIRFAMASGFLAAATSGEFNCK
jgi:hypothetical protein